MHVYTFLLRFLRHEALKFGVASKRMLHSVALVVLCIWVMQILTGLIMIGLLSYKLEIQFEQLLLKQVHGYFVWLVRQSHMLGSNLAVILLGVHIAKAISCYQVVTHQKFVIWLVGSAIFLLVLAGAFTGYVLVCGNMSYWAAIVILNLVTVIPLISDPLIKAVLGGNVMSSWGLRRFTELHFLLTLACLALTVLHLLLLHRTEPSSSGHMSTDGTTTLSNVLAKDMIILAWAFLMLFWWSLYSLIHPDNWVTFSTLATPEHIEPEVYFLWTFAIIKLHNSKLAGAVLLAATV